MKTKQEIKQDFLFRVEQALKSKETVSIELVTSTGQKTVFSIVGLKDAIYERDLILKQPKNQIDKYHKFALKNLSNRIDNHKRYINRIKRLPLINF